MAELQLDDILQGPARAGAIHVQRVRGGKLHCGQSRPGRWVNFEHRLRVPIRERCRSCFKQLGGVEATW